MNHLSMARTSHLVLAIQGDSNLGLPFKGSQEITNGCLQGVRKAYQVLAILGNPTFKPPPRGSQEITNGSGSPKKLTECRPR